MQVYNCPCHVFYLSLYDSGFFVPLYAVEMATSEKEHQAIIQILKEEIKIVNQKNVWTIVFSHIGDLGFFLSFQHI